MDRTSIMIDTGTATIAAGFCGQELPSICIPNCISQTINIPNTDVCYYNSLLLNIIFNIYIYI